MSFFNFFRSTPPASDIDLQNVEVDLGTFTCGRTSLGEQPNPRDPFAPYLERSDSCKFPDKGFEAGIKDGNLDYVYVEVKSFDGRFLLNCQPFDIGPSTSPEDIRNSLGEPWWIDRDESEVILFYEYRRGEVEVQFEFPDGKTLEIITLMKNGVLSGSEQRQNYGVTKPWPPQETI
jgi:hypothetical protein